METGLMDDKRAATLLSRVREDLAGLKEDVGILVRHAGTHTLPEVVRGGREFARERIGRAGQVVREHPAGVSIGGALLVGAVAAGVWWLLKGGCCGKGGGDV